MDSVLGGTAMPIDNTIQTFPEMKPVGNTTKDPDSLIKCPKCSKSNAMHPDYVRAGFSPCVGRNKCHNMETMIKNMLTYRGWVFRQVDNLDFGKKISFICNTGHNETLTWNSFKKGSNCKRCIAAKITKDPKPKRVLIRPECECKGYKGKGKPSICPHYNLMTHGSGIEEWNSALNNGADMNKISACTQDVYWFTCKNSWCHMNYQQSPHHRFYLEQRCCYCSGTKVCEWNSLLSNYPELCSELDPSNQVGPHQITTGTQMALGWICVNHNPPHHYSTTPERRIRGTGCPKCVKGYDQKVGGHEYFIAECNKIFGNKYRYDDPYSGSMTPIRIWCNQLTRSIDGTSTPHGYFIQTPSNHKRGHGCPVCQALETDSKIMKRVLHALQKLGYANGKDYVREVTMPGLKNKYPLRLDIYISSVNLVIEVDGGYHFSPSGHANLEAFHASQQRDMIKDAYVIDHKINLLRIPEGTKSIKACIKRSVDTCRLGYHMYASYGHYMMPVFQSRSRSGILCFEMPCPLSEN
jgi:hypothetical protein